MKNHYLKGTTLSVLIVLPCIILFQLGCAPTDTTPKAPSHDEMVARGRYLVTGGLCNDCHSPKVFSAAGMEADTTKLLSGHPDGGPGAVMDTNSLHPGYGYTCAPDLTAWLGPWGISYPANITPDSTTGIGAWSEETFIKTIRSGKHLGLEGGRALLPPMPWKYISVFTDEDLKSIYAYLRSLPAIKNRVPAPVSPDGVRAMAMAMVKKK